MRRTVQFLFLCLLFSCSSSGEKENTAEKKPVNDQMVSGDTLKRKDLEPKLIVGKTCGECSGICFIAYTIVDNKVYVHKSSAIPADSEFRWQLCIEPLRSKVKAAFENIPNNLGYYKSPIGCPDCHDQ